MSALAVRAASHLGDNIDPNPNPNFAAQSSDYFRPVARRPAGETAHRCEQSVSSLF